MPKDPLSVEVIVGLILAALVMAVLILVGVLMQ